VTDTPTSARASTAPDFHDLALAELKLVKDDRQLSAWHAKFMAGEEYLHANPEVVADLEAAYRTKLAWVWGLGA
jgi:hypothetical protein